MNTLFELNFAENKEAIGFLDGASDAKEMLFRITSISKVPMIPGKTLIFFDEIQEIPNFGIEKGIVFCNDNLHIEGALTYLPIYMVMFIKNKVSISNPIYKLDLTGLSGYF